MPPLLPLPPLCLPHCPLLLPLLLILWVVPLLSFPLPRNVSSLFRTANVTERPPGAGFAITGQKPRPRRTRFNVSRASLYPDRLRASACQHCALPPRKRQVCRNPTRPGQSDSSDRKVSRSGSSSQSPSSSAGHCCTRIHLQSGRFVLPRALACGCLVASPGRGVIRRLMSVRRCRMPHQRS